MIADDYFLHKHLQRKDAIGSRRERPRCLSCIHAACKHTVVTPKPGAEWRRSVHSEIPNALRLVRAGSVRSADSAIPCFQEHIKVWDNSRTSLSPGPNWNRKLKSEIRVRSTQSLKMTHLPCRAVNPSMPGFFGVKGGTVFHCFRGLYLQRGCACNPNIPGICALLRLVVTGLPAKLSTSSLGCVESGSVPRCCCSPPGPPGAFGCFDSPAPHELPGSARRDPGGGYGSADWRWRGELLR